MMLPWSSVAMAADPVKGRTYYAAHCANCHGVNGVNRIPGAPDFSRGESLLQPDNVLIAKIKAGKGMMPAYRGVVSDDEILDIIAHLRTLRR